MKRRRILIMIDQAARDAFSQLLVARYLSRKGATVLLCNQHTLVGMCERYRPDVFFSSWLVGGPLMDYLIRRRGRMRLALMDQEGGRIGEEPFKRTFKLSGGAKAHIAKICDAVFVWGSAQAQWLRETGLIPPERIVVTGSPRFDPYLVPGAPGGEARSLGVTLRGDPLTSLPTKLMETVYQFSASAFPHGIGVGYPTQSQYEDKMWHIVATMRALFKTALAFSRVSRAPIVFRPGPWEQPQQYAFLPSRIPSAVVRPHQLQHDYARGAFALLDESSSLGLEGLLCGVPVVSMQEMIPRLEGHFVGEGGSLFDAPYMECYWRPRTIEEAVELLAQAEAGRLAPSPNPASLQRYLAACHQWPRTRPSSFEIGDRLLALGGLPRRDESEREPPTFTERCYQWLPGSVALVKAKAVCREAYSSNRRLWFRYHYYDMFYPYHAEVAAVFRALWAADQPAPAAPGDGERPKAPLTLAACAS